MANEDIFGTAQPVADPAFVRSQREATQQQEAYDAYLARQEKEDRFGGPSTNSTRRAAKRENKAIFKEDYQRRMTGKSQEEMRAELGATVNQKVAQDPSFRAGSGMTAEERSIRTMEIAANEADKMGMGSLAAQLAQQIVKRKTEKIKADLENEKLEAEISQKEASTAKDKAFTVPGRDAQGNKTEQQAMRQPNGDIELIGDEYVTEYGKWYSVPIGGGESRLYDATGTIQEVTTEAQAAAKLKEMESAQTAFTAIDDQLRTAEKAIANIGEYGYLTAGVGANLKERSALPGVGNPAKQLASLLTTLKSALSFDRLQLMREMSKTGGALGQVSVRELDLLESNLVKLDQHMEPDLLAENIQEIIDHYTTSRDILTKKIQMEDIDWFDDDYAKFTTQKGGKTYLDFGPDGVFGPIEE